MAVLVRLGVGCPETFVLDRLLGMGLSHSLAEWLMAEFRDDTLDKPLSAKPSAIDYFNRAIVATICAMFGLAYVRMACLAQPVYPDLFTVSIVPSASLALWSLYLVLRNLRTWARLLTERGEGL
jgi:hypothetical protein